MKNILIIAALLLSLPAMAQYPASPTTKVDLGRQTTGDGLTFRGAGAPAYTPSSKNNAWVYLDTLTGITHYYYAAAWRGCAITWLPMLLIENSQQQRQTGAAVESFRNEMVKANDTTSQILFAATQQTLLK